MTSVYNLLLIYSIITSLLTAVSAIKCFQCSSDEDAKGEDNCGAYEYFDSDRNIAVDCMGEEAVTPGTFCYKSIKQGPRGFIWDGRWRSVVRRCAQVSERGISWGCDWGYHENGVYWEECYCAEDSCNYGSTLSAQLSHHTLTLLSVIYIAIKTLVTIYM